jgi:hypothetical protein
MSIKNVLKSLNNGVRITSPHITEINQISDITIYNLAKETTILLNNKQVELSNIQWTNGESNLDTEYSQLACICCCEAWNNIIKKSPVYEKIIIKCVIPDINIQFTYPNGAIFEKKIELKSSKSSKMPGSTIKKLDINQPLIYCLRSRSDNGKYELRCSQYHNAMGESNIDLFQDRTPRPFINFKKMKEIGKEEKYDNKKHDSWINHYANCAITRISPDQTCNKSSWQDDMMKIIKKKIINDFIQNTTTQDFEDLQLSLLLQTSLQINK